MADQERNFRSQYYDKVGFRSVEEKKSIESLLKDKTMKHEKLVQFCIRFGLPAMYRLYVWKILLGTSMFFILVCPLLLSYDENLVSGRPTIFFFWAMLSTNLSIPTKAFLNHSFFVGHAQQWMIFSLFLVHPMRMPFSGTKAAVLWRPSQCIAKDFWVYHD